MGSSPVVSVVIPAYNHAEYILACLDSVFKQSYRDFEILLIDDGSPDQTADMVRPFVSDGTIRYFRQENSGQAQARNRGLQEARGKYIAYLDDDDLWPSDKLEWQVAALEANSWCAVGGTVEVLGEPSQDSDVPCSAPFAHHSSVRLQWQSLPISRSGAGPHRGPPISGRV
ncbi:glycosyltransferase family A protein [Verrucomicrobium sp. BvORR034]|uniref:glycosyltransferase family 2 protein n=1 Tax=Verrucomicrobium sp. BvORR034 TaxID=1396418 RepID=UPI00067970B3|nr:glycosyltransferase family A protein [Verrucomicrobium sp. BvORR034]